jgi:hypothetical protein
MKIKDPDDIFIDPIIQYDRKYPERRLYLAVILQALLDATRIKGNQVGGDHYKNLTIQPTEYIMANDLNFCEGNVVKYVTRHRVKGEGLQDLLKARHYIDLCIEYLYGENSNESTN